MKKITLTLVVVAIFANLCNAQNRLGVSIHNVITPDNFFVEKLQSDYSFHGSYSDYFLYNILATGGYITDEDLSKAKSILNRVGVPNDLKYACIKEYTMFDDTPTYKLVWYETNAEMSGIFKYQIESCQEMVDLIYDAYGIQPEQSSNPLLSISFTLPYPIENSNIYGEYLIVVNDKPTAAGYSYLMFADSKLYFELPKIEMEKLCGKKLDYLVNTDSTRTVSL